MNSKHDLFIEIDDYIFTIINKKFIKNENGDILRFFIDYKSKNKISSEEINLTAYTSVSELGCLRVCFRSNSNHHRIDKFDNYVQSTILDLRLQKFIISNLDLIPEIQFSEEFPCPVKNNISSKIIKNRILDLNVVDNEPIYIKLDLPKHISPPIEQTMFGPPSLQAPSYTYEIDIPWNENNFDIIDSKNNSVEKTTKISDLKIDLLTYETILDNIKINNNLFGIRIKNKLNNSIIIIIIGYCKIDIDANDEHPSIHKEGYYIMNLIPDDYKINSYGLYDKYYNGSHDELHGMYNPVMYYVTKPLEYKNQIETNMELYKYLNLPHEYDEFEIFNIEYEFIAGLNKNKFIINRLIQENSFTQSTFPTQNEKKEFFEDYDNNKNYEQKYLKYKNKYLSLKNKK
jgi:hypothetical protein